MSPISDAEQAHFIDDLVDAFVEKYAPSWPATVKDVWWNKFRDTPVEVLAAARDDYFAHETEAPRNGKFGDYVNRHLQSHLRLPLPPTPMGRCGCADGWRETADGAVFPCDQCQPDLHAQWAGVWVPEAKAQRRVRPAVDFDYDPAVKIDQSRSLLDNVRSLERTHTKDASHL